MVNRMLAVTCWITVLATVYLSLSVVVLHPQRVNFQAWFLAAAFLVAQSALTLAAVAGVARGGWTRGALLTGSVALVVAGVWSVHGTLSGSHFEGYALVLGSLVVVQGALTLLSSMHRDDIRSAAPPTLL